jgi:hypothetical protein
MSVGTGAALAIGAGISAGTSLAGAKLQSNAAKKAAETQAASADKAMAYQAELAKQAMGLQGQMWGGIQQMYSPYTQSAPATLSALHEYLGIPGASQSQTMVPYGAYGPPMRQPFLGQPGAGGPPPGGMPPGMGRPPGFPMPGGGGGAVPRMRQPGAPAGPGMMPMSSVYRRGAPPLTRE